MKKCDCPCKDCTQRRLGCHENCVKYKIYRELYYRDKRKKRKIPTCKQYLKETLIRHFNSVEYAFWEFDVPELTVFSIVGNVK